MSAEEDFQAFWEKKTGTSNRHPREVLIRGYQFYDLLLEAFTAGRESVEPVINPEWCKEIVTLHRSNSNFWTIPELAKLFQLPEDQVREILNAKQDATG
jgi:hypothetical protein